MEAVEATAEIGEALKDAMRGEWVGRAGKVGIFPDVLVDGREMELIESATLLDTSKGGAAAVVGVLARAVISFVWRPPGVVLQDSISGGCLLGRGRDCTEMKSIS